MESVGAHPINTVFTANATHVLCNYMLAYAASSATTVGSSSSCLPNKAPYWPESGPLSQKGLLVCYQNPGFGTDSLVSAPYSAA